MIDINKVQGEINALLLTNTTTHAENKLIGWILQTLFMIDNLQEQISDLQSIHTATDDNTLTQHIIKEKG